MAEPRKNFSWDELTCKCGCGCRNILEDSLDALQAVRFRIGRPMIINSAARCEQHNRSVGGSPQSFHLCKPDRAACAYDIAVKDGLGLSTHDPEELIRIAKEEGFKGIGRYRNFVHLDFRPVAWEWDAR